MNKTSAAEAPSAKTPRRIGIFRRIAVERYVRPLMSDLPELLAPWNGGTCLAGVALLVIAVLLLW